MTLKFKDNFVRVVVRITKPCFEPSAESLRIVASLYSLNNWTLEDTFETSFIGFYQWFTEVGLPKNSSIKYKLITVHPKTNTILHEENFERQLELGHVPVMLNLTYNSQEYAKRDLRSSLTKTGNPVSVSIKAPDAEKINPKPGGWDIRKENVSETSLHKAYYYTFHDRVLCKVLSPPRPKKPDFQGRLETSNEKGGQTSRELETLGSKQDISDRKVQNVRQLPDSRCGQTMNNGSESRITHLNGSEFPEMHKEACSCELENTSKENMRILTMPLNVECDGVRQTVHKKNIFLRSQTTNRLQRSAVNWSTENETPTTIDNAHKNYKSATLNKDVQTDTYTRTGNNVRRGKGLLEVEKRNEVENDIRLQRGMVEVINASVQTEREKCNCVSGHKNNDSKYSCIFEMCLKYAFPVCFTGALGACLLFKYRSL